MTFKKFLSYFKINESLKEDRLNKILDKMSSGSTLSKTDKDFLDQYDKKTDSDVMDSRMLSRETTFEKIRSLLDENKRVICNINYIESDENQIVEIFNNFEQETSILTLSNNKRFKLKDNFLYNIIYNIDKDEYSLEVESEFYEKIPVKNDEN